MNLVQNMSGQISKRDSTGFGELLGPVFLRCPRELNATLGRSLCDVLECTTQELSDALRLNSGTDETPLVTGSRKRKAYRNKTRKNGLIQSDNEADLLGEPGHAPSVSKPGLGDEIIELMTLHYDITATVVESDLLRRWLRGFGKAVTVLAPKGILD